MNIPITKPYFTKEEEKEVIDVLRTGWIMQGKKVARLEKELSKLIGIGYAILVSSGTTALHLALLSLGIGPNDEVIVPSFSWVSSANAILYVGARPVFADIDPLTYNIDPSEIERKITKKTKAIMVVHQIGLACDLDPIIKIAQKNNLLLLEDAACALGATYNGKSVGAFGNIACFSFHPRKSITTGEGGLVVTKDKKIAETILSLRNHGVTKTKEGEKIENLGYNYRMTDIQAAVGIAQFKKLESILKKRSLLAQRYNKAFKNLNKITSPYTPSNRTHTYQSYLIKLKGGKSFRNRIAKELAKRGIATRLSIMSIHREPFYQKLIGKISLPQTEKAQDEGLIIPLYPQMSIKEQEYVIKNLLEVID